MITEKTPSLTSVVVALDGEAKCGKTTVADGMREVLSDGNGLHPSIWRPDLEFSQVASVSAGSMFRTVALYKALVEVGGGSVEEFTSSDSDAIEALLEEPGIHDVLQRDPNVESQVSIVAQMAGVQALCGTLFANSVLEAFNHQGGGNLVIVDARDPVERMISNGIVGNEAGLIPPGSIVPVYIDTPVEVAAQRLPGGLESNIFKLRNRRNADATRAELPVKRPDLLIDDYDEWSKMLLLDDDRDIPLAPYRLDNGEDMPLDDLRLFNKSVTSLTLRLAHRRYMQNQPESVLSTISR